jgi:GNAT superfamily N-acetyltransferase
MTAMELCDYEPSMNEEALALERACPQGRAIRLRFERDTFHRRAGNFERYRILAARRAGRMVGILAAAIKPGWVRGRSAPVYFLFDLRVLPSARGGGVARALAEELIQWAMQETKLGYLYTIGDNMAVARLGEIFGATECGGFSYLVLPATGGRRCDHQLERVGRAGAHAIMSAISAPFDLYTPADASDGNSAYVRSWVMRRGSDVAVCSAWSNQNILAEVVERLPPHVALLGNLTRLLPRAAGLPRVPRAGQTIRSWYLFDLAATHVDLGRDLIREVRAEAGSEGVDLLYLPHLPGDSMAAAVAVDLPRIFTHRIRYRLLARGEGVDGGFVRPYIDVRDL